MAGRNSPGHGSFWRVAIILDMNNNREYHSVYMDILRTIDEIDLQILHILQEKARIPNAEVSRQVGMAPSAVLERIRKLEERGIIEGYEVRLNPHPFAQGLAAFIFVEVDPTANGTLGKRLAALAGPGQGCGTTGRQRERG